MTSDEFTNEQLDENLHKWFKEKWVRFGPDGKIRGACARGDDSEGKPKCLPQKKAQNLGKKGRKYAASKKRREDPNPERSGKAKNVATKKKTNEGTEQNYLSLIPNLTWNPLNRSVWNTIQFEGLDEEQDAPKHTDWVMASLPISPEDAQALQAFDNDAIEDFNRFDIHLKSRYPGLTDLIDYDNGTVTIVKPSQMQDMAEGYRKEDIPFNQCPKCRGPIVHESMLNEKQDACYHKVKSRYKVWPSAYASGALVQCRKKGASNWGTGGKKKTESSIMKGIVDEAGSAAQQAAIAISMKKKGQKPKHVDEAKAKQYVKPFMQDGKQVGWKSSDGYHVKYWQIFAKDSAIKHAKLNPDEVQEDYTGEFAAEKTPTVNPHAGIKDNQFRGAISEMPDTSGPVGTQPGGWRRTDMEEATKSEFRQKTEQQQYDKLEKIKNSSLPHWAKEYLTLLNDPKGKVFKAAYYSFPKGQAAREEAAQHIMNKYKVPQEMLNKVKHGEMAHAAMDRPEDRNYDFDVPSVHEDTAYAGGMGQGGNAGESYRKFTPKSAGTFKEDELDEACWKGYHKEGNKKMFGKTYPNCVKNTNEEEQLDEKCWDTHKQVGMKNKGGKQVPNCVPKESAIMKGIKGK